jgi:NAD(P)-dependent dehydrogenase (short-subunit alcohol dehydrogenase family)
VFVVNVRGALFTVQKLLPLMSNGGSIILNGSAVWGKGIPGQSVYAATKAALRSFARTWAAELAERGVRVNVLSPGADRHRHDRRHTTGIARTDRRPDPLEAAGRARRRRQGRIVFASDDSSFVTGIDLSVDGGAGQI